MSTRKYDEIIGLAHHTSPTRTRMSMRDRAAQFAPFAALTGYDSLVEETARLTDSENEMGEYDVARLDTKLRILKEHERNRPYVEITHFVPDKKKAGGRYETSRGRIYRIDEIEKLVWLDGEKKISFERISAISSLLFTDE